MNLPEGHVLEVRRAKIVDYLLNVNHPDGRPKALFFICNGLSRDRPEELTAILRKHFLECETPVITESPFGMKIVVEGDIRLPTSTLFRFRSVWIQEEGKKIINFVTAYRI